MQYFKRIICLFLCCTVMILCTACGTKTSFSKAFTNGVQIGVLYKDTALSGRPSCFQRTGLEAAVRNAGLDDEIIHSKFNITDLSEKRQDLSAQAETTEAVEKTEPESYTDKDGNLHVKAIPLTPEKSETAQEAVKDLLDSGCSLLIFTDSIYENLSEETALLHNDILVMQYQGANMDIPNLVPYSERMADGFYLAGVTAAAQGVKHIGFTAGKIDTHVREWINAFGQALSDAGSDAAVTVRSTGSDMDLYLEQTIPQQLIQEDKCDLLIQSVYTAIPMTVAAAGTDGKGAGPVACIGFGSDMQADGGEKYLCSIVPDFGALFLPVLQDLQAGKYDPQPIHAGFPEGVITLTELQNASQAAKESLQSIETKWEKKGKANFKITEIGENGFVSNVTVK